MLYVDINTKKTFVWDLSPNKGLANLVHKLVNREQSVLTVNYLLATPLCNNNYTIMLYKYQ